MRPGDPGPGCYGGWVCFDHPEEESRLFVTGQHFCPFRLLFLVAPRRLETLGREPACSRPRRRCPQDWALPCSGSLPPGCSRPAAHTWLF